MGGHTQFGEYLTLEAAVKAFYAYYTWYVMDKNLHLREAQITYNYVTNKFKLSMRFTK